LKVFLHSKYLIDDGKNKKNDPVNEMRVREWVKIYEVLGETASNATLFPINPTKLDLESNHHLAGSQAEINRMRCGVTKFASYVCKI
jgi:hypothetical protein